MINKKIFWGDFHTNMHSRHMEEFDQWVEFAQTMVDFWGPVYYPYSANKIKEGFSVEGLEPKDIIERCWKKVNEASVNENFIIYPSYEWQGNGADGDHNVFYTEFDEAMHLPNTYEELCTLLSNKNAIAIPHHPGYKPGHRGKNWETHNSVISPVVEIYSSHGSSESSTADIPMNVHMHMGPRAEEGTIMWALKQGIKVGIIASGDNHKYPAISGNGYFAVYCEKYDRYSILDAVRKRHTYGVTRSKIGLYYDINGYLMGSEIKLQPNSLMNINVSGTNAVKAIEIYRNGHHEYTYNYYQNDELPDNGIVKFKFELELGWGPDRRLFNDISKKIWDIKLKTTGKIIDIEKLWTSPGSHIQMEDEQTISGQILTRKEDDGNGKLSQKNYLTPYIQNQSIIIELQADINSEVLLVIDNKEYSYPVRKILSQAILEADLEASEKLLKERFDFTEFYREDPWWHNSYKFLLHKGNLSTTYEISETYKIDKLIKEEDNILVKVIQRNNDIAWGSPIYISK